MEYLNILILNDAFSIKKNWRFKGKSNKLPAKAFKVMLINGLDRLSAVKIHFYNMLCLVRAPLPATSWFMAIDLWKKKSDFEIESLSYCLVHLIFISTFISELLLKPYISALPFFVNTG